MEKAGLAEQINTRWYIKHLDKKFFAKSIKEHPEEIFTESILNQLNEFLATTGYQTIDLETKKMIETENVVIEEENNAE